MKKKTIKIIAICIIIIAAIIGTCLIKNIELNINDDKVQTVNETVQTSNKNLSDENSVINTEETTEEEVEKQTNTNATIVMVGDVLLHTPVSESGIMEDGTYNYDHLFKNIRNDISAADIAIVNEEVVLGGKELGISGYPSFNGAYEVGDAIVNAGFDVVLHATNHALDKGKIGVTNCLNFWKKYSEIGVVGINLSQDEQNNIYVKEVNGIKIAILNYTYGTNGISLPDNMPYIVNLLDKEKIEKDVNTAKTISDFIIVCPHWGTEYTHQETEEQEEWAKYFANLGVNLVIGTHPHVIEPVKWVESPNGNRTLVYYSLGNFINATSDYGEGTADRMVGAMANITIEKTNEGNVRIVDYKAIPLVTQMITGRGMITTYKLSDYTQELASLNEINQRDSRFSYEFCVNLCNNIFEGINN